MRKVKWVSKCIDRALSHGIGVINRNGQEICHMEYRKDSGEFLVRHYDTTILILDLNERKIRAWGGYSPTDARIINNVLGHFEMYHPQLRYAKSKHTSTGLKEWELVITDLYPEVLTWEQLDILREKVIKKIKKIAVEMEEPTHVEINYSDLYNSYYVSINEVTACQFNVNDYTYFEKNGKQESYIDYFDHDSILRLELTSVLKDVRDLIAEGFFHSYFEDVKEIFTGEGI